MNQHPACFASFLAFAANDSVCQSCAFFAECEEQSYQTLLAVRDRVNVERRIKERNRDRVRAGQTAEQPDGAVSAPETRGGGAKRTLTEAQEQLLRKPTLSKKAADLLRRMFQRGIDGTLILSALEQQQNPFVNETPEVMRMACDLLLEGGFTKASLRDRFAASGMATKTAQTRASVVCTAFEHLAVITNDNGTFKARYE